MSEEMITKLVHVIGQLFIFGMMIHIFLKFNNCY